LCVLPSSVLSSCVSDKIKVLIAFRIIQSQRTLRKLSTASSARLFNTLVIILESAAIYSSATIVLLTTTVIGTNSAFVVLDMVRPPSPPYIFYL
jgi:hypothetical protein